jgi:hypothetical protein
MNFFHRFPKQEAVKMQAMGIPSPISPLVKLVIEDPKLYGALQNFLIVDPKRQLPLFDDVSSLLSKGDAAKAQGNNLTARVDYEVAAKIEIYKQNKDSATSFLVLAEGVTDRGEQHFGYQETMLADMDKVLQISKAYQPLPQSMR